MRAAARLLARKEWLGGVRWPRQPTRRERSARDRLGQAVEARRRRRRHRHHHHRQRRRHRRRQARQAQARRDRRAPPRLPHLRGRLRHRHRRRQRGAAAEAGAAARRRQRGAEAPAADAGRPSRSPPRSPPPPLLRRAPPQPHAARPPLSHCASGDPARLGRRDQRAPARVCAQSCEAGQAATLPSAGTPCPRHRRNAQAKPPPAQRASTAIPIERVAPWWVAPPTGIAQSTQ